MGNVYTNVIGFYSIIERLGSRDTEYFFVIGLIDYIRYLVRIVMYVCISYLVRFG